MSHEGSFLTQDEEAHGLHLAHAHQPSKDQIRWTMNTLIIKLDQGQTPHEHKTSCDKQGT